MESNTDQDIDNRCLYATIRQLHVKEVNFNYTHTVFTTTYTVQTWLSNHNETLHFYVVFVSHPIGFKYIGVNHSCGVRVGVGVMESKSEGLLSGVGVSKNVPTLIPTSI
jgi:hypothetical protein